MKVRIDVSGRVENDAFEIGVDGRLGCPFGPSALRSGGGRTKRPRPRL